MTLASIYWCLQFQTQPTKSVKSIAAILITLLTICVLQAQENRPLLYPFDVTIGDQKAVMQEANSLFAVVEKPVSSDALLKIEKEVPMLIINVFSVKEDGTVMEAGAQPAILIAQKANSVKLSATMDKKKLKPGRYLANIVAGGTTSRVVFVVKDPTGKIKIPSIKKLIDFLKK